MNKVGLFASLTLIGLGLGACQSDADKVAQVENELRQAYAATTNEQSPKDKQVQEYVEGTPDLHRVSWKVCGDGKLSVTMNEEINKGCNETRNEPAKGFFQPAYVWGPVKEVKFVNKPDLSPSLQITGLFVKSRGCVSLGQPGAENFYRVSEFTLKKASANLPKDAKTEVIPKQEKQEILSAVIGNAESELTSIRNFGVSSNGLLPTGSTCPTLGEWEKGF
ncbi:hypothetical protein ACN23B_28085 (plasmid) [Anabaena sp. FACHB-709]|uniref:Lipoprotein n=2 Tax=Nostocaceae TaxID=1162 RepID=A0A1Z4KUJ7_ANAVA|nr:MULTISPECIES: hypothetical protein [Nostocaceae]BAY72598.1 hypothetical protein NIES23_54260 [Trichormus variabilis NIES-23]MBD2174186.1 hypothetical protein [Anabaena cylindrica FACHB-318]MBD2265976.1 hypothetical protein [Anabaena sp. FACHB-709]MBD2275492.1 hypothetical protein [Nostoc sp. PCC 7120 = FACHB-418]MBD2286318.1 hypothetical protein [Anabaena cylindrica FACHB-170]